MAKEIKSKKRLVTSINNLTDDLQAELKIKYPDGFTEHMIRIEKGFNDFFYAVTLETEDISYLVKVNVKIDDTVEDEDNDDKDYFDDEIKNAEDIIDLTEDQDND